MANPVLDVDEQSFEAEVLTRSHELPVVVDFWAPWCGPCRMLAPVLERLIATEFAGQVVLAKLNTDDNPGLSQAFRIQGIPAVKAFRNGQVVSEFTGALPESEVRRFLASLGPSPADVLATEASDRLASGDRVGAEAALRAAIEADRQHPAALLALGKLLEGQGDLDGALDTYARVPVSSPEEAESARRAAAIEILRETRTLAGEPELRRRLAVDTEDVEANYGLALHAALEERFVDAFDHLLVVVKRDRKFGDDAGRKRMLTVFQLVGPRSDLADEYRTKLARALY